jgi:hypothetical protein
MVTPTDKPFRISDGERAAPPPPVVPAQRLPLPNQEGSNGTEHSLTVPWPPVQDLPAMEQNPGPAKPYKGLR